jgi:hypothetical protein
MVFLVVLMAVAATAAVAERVYLTNGDIITGTIVESNDDEVIVETNIGRARIPRAQIDRIEFSDQNSSEDGGVKNEAFLFRPLPTVLGLVAGSVQMVMEGQSAISPTWSLGGTFAFNLSGGISGMESQIGAQYRPLGRHLHGLYIELMPGFGWLSDAYDMLWFGTLSLNAGYQWVADGGFTLNLGGGVMVSTLSVLPIKPNLIFGIGYAFSGKRSGRES